MGVIRIAAAAAHFGRDLDFDLGRIGKLITDARAAAALWSAGVDFIQGNFVQRAGHDLAFDFHASVM